MLGEPASPLGGPCHVPHHLPATPGEEQGPPQQEVGHSLQAQAHAPSHRQGLMMRMELTCSCQVEVGAPSKVPHSSCTQQCLQQPGPRLHGCTVTEVAWSTLGGGRGGRTSWCFWGLNSNKQARTQEPHSVTWIKQIGDMPSVAEGSRPHQSDSVIGLILSIVQDVMKRHLGYFVSRNVVTPCPYSALIFLQCSRDKYIHKVTIQKPCYTHRKYYFFAGGQRHAE